MGALRVSMINLGSQPVGDWVDLLASKHLHCSSLPFSTNEKTVLRKVSGLPRVIQAVIVELGLNLGPWDFMPVYPTVPTIPPSHL